MFSGPYFSAFGLNTERYKVSFRIQSECGKYGPEKLRIRPLFTQKIANVLGVSTSLLGRKRMSEEIENNNYSNINDDKVNALVRNMFRDSPKMGKRMTTGALWIKG